MIRLFGWLGRRRLDRELAEEMETHLAERIAELTSQGLDAGDARAQARREFGNLTAIRERGRDVWSWHFIDDAHRTIAHAARALAHGGSFTAVSILTLALGIGANTAVFTLIHAILLRPLPYAAPEQLVRNGVTLPGMRKPVALTPEFVAFRNENHTFSGLVAWNDEESTLTGAGEPQRVTGASVSADFLQVLGVTPLIGRDFRAEDDRAGAPPVLLISSALWRRGWNSSASLGDRKIALDDKEVTVVGVLPPDFLFPGNLRPDFLIPGQLGEQPDWSAMRMGILTVIGRLKPGVSRAAAAADLTSISQRHQRDKPAFWAASAKDLRVQTMGLQADLVGDVRPALLALFWAAGVVLLIACVNVASLQLSRFNGRIRELAVRAALGAGKLRLVWLISTECLLLSAAGAVVGIASGWALVRLARPFYELLHLAGPEAIALNGPVVAFSVSLTLASALLFAAAPAVLTQSIAFRSGLHDAGNRAVSGLRNLFRSALMVTEVTMAVVLLLSAGLLVRSLMRLTAVAPGFETKGVMSMSVTLPDSRYHDERQRSAFAGDLAARLRVLPGVADVGVSSSPPFTPYHLGASVFFEGQPVPPPAHRPNVPVISALPGYFRSLGIPFLAGHDISSGDASDHPWVCVVNAAFVQQFFPKQDPIGRRIQWGAYQTNPWATIVGVVANSHHFDLGQPPDPELYVSFDQFPNPQVTALMRTSLPPESIVNGARAQVHAIDPEEAVFAITTMEDRVNESLRDRRVETALLGVFALLALCLAAAGVYGVMSYSVAQSTREIGVRMALGATRAKVAGLVLRRAFLLSVLGVGAGVGLAAYCTRFLASFLYGVGTRDPFTFIAGAVFLVVVSLVATYLPARRAASVDPVEALRAE